MSETKLIKDIEETMEVPKTKKDKVESSEIKSSKTKKSKNSTKIIIGTIIILTLFILLFFNAKNSLEPKNDTYNGFSFFEDDSGFWETYVTISGTDYQIVFNHHPKEILDIYVNPLIKNRLRLLDARDHLVMAIDEDAHTTSVVAASQLARLHKLNYLMVPINGAMYDENFNLTEHFANPEKNETAFTTNCKLSSDSFVVMRFKKGNETSMDFYDNNPNCIYVTAQEPEDFRRLADKLAYDLLGIIDQE